MLLGTVVAAGVAHDGGDDHHQGEGGGVDVVGEEGHGAKVSQTGGEEGLGTVRDDALHDARTGVEHAGCEPRVEAEATRNVGRNFAHGDDGDGVVGGAEVDQTD